MIAGILGVVGFVLVLFAVGAFMEGDIGKMLKFGAAIVVCSAITIMTASKHTGSGGSQNCHIEWDGFSNPEVCD